MAMQNSARACEKNRSGRLWRHECALHLGKNAQRPDELASFDRVLCEINVVVTPGADLARKAKLCPNIAFNSRENAEEVARRLKELK